MPLEGRFLSIRWALALDYYVGFRSLKLVQSVAVMSAESDRWTGAWNENPNGSVDRGLFQINSIHDHRLAPEEAFDPIPNATFAVELSRAGKNWSPWYAYGGTRYAAAYALTLAVWALGLWRTRIERVEDELG